MKRPVSGLATQLLAWYDRVHLDREMPWRASRDPYAIWLSETMLQQTQVETVKPYYARFLKRFPTVAALAAAPLEDVLTLWAGLGYYRRARHLHAAARRVVEAHGGKLPSDVDMLMDLPGVGRYTAGAVGSIAFGLPAAVVDGNVIRVLARLTGYDKDVSVPRNVEFFWETATAILQGAEGRFGDVNQALMELGATVCTPVNPKCGACPARSFCRGLAEGRTEELPVKAKRGKVAEVCGTAMVILRAAQTTKRGKGSGPTEVLVMKRPRGIWEDMWEFPVLGAKGKELDGGVISNELGVRVSELCALGEVKHSLTHRTMLYDVMVCRAGSEQVRLPACVTGGRYADARWVKWPLEKEEFPMARVVGKIAEMAWKMRQGGSAG